MSVVATVALCVIALVQVLRLYQWAAGNDLLVAELRELRRELHRQHTERRS